MLLNLLPSTVFLERFKDILYEGSRLGVSNFGRRKDKRSYIILQRFVHFTKTQMGVHKGLNKGIYLPHEQHLADPKEVEAGLWE